MKILKFGGSSVENSRRILQVIGILRNYKENNMDFAVVCSALKGVTDNLIEIGEMASGGQGRYLAFLDDLEKRHREIVCELIKSDNQGEVFLHLNNEFQSLRNILYGVFLIKELSLRTLDFIMSFGESLSSYIITEVLKENSVEAEFLDARKLVKTDNNFGNARVERETTYKNIRAYFEKHKSTQIITGFIGATENNETTTLGRGGSDYTASIFGAALLAEEIEIWTDVNGIMTTDPGKVEKAFSLDTITYEEAMELSHFGAKVIYPPTLQPVLEKKIPIRVRNIFCPEFAGTIIQEKGCTGDFLIRGISSILDISLLRIQGSGMIGVAGIAKRIFSSLAKKDISVILISQASSEHSICFAITPERAAYAKKIIEEEFLLEIHNRDIDKIIIEDNLSIIAIVGENMKRTVGISGRLFQALGKNGINVVAIAQGSSELNISVVINKYDEKKALNVIHEAFFLSDTKTINLFLVGTGQIGSTLLAQIENNKSYLLKEHSIELRITGLSNSRKMIFKEDGISLKNWREILDKSQEPADMERFVANMKGMNLPNSIFIDCTASEEVVSYYKDIFAGSISIVTPNKKVNSGNYKIYRELKDRANKYKVKFLYETNVGAGLPIINTLQDLISSGDKILKIEAVLSGTLSYIFNNFRGDGKFSSIVKKAKEEGYTEPDPRDDLGGLDVARKLLILARETGLELELEDVEIMNILPDSLKNAERVDEFLSGLENEDGYFDEIKKSAEDSGCLLRYIARLERGRAYMALEKITEEHPFYNLSGSDNIIAFTTERYKERPLVVKGPGAGREVTAAGVFADIIRIASYLVLL